MSSYYAAAIHPDTGVVEHAFFIDDHFGRHAYGVQFADGSVWPVNGAIYPSEQQIKEALDYKGETAEDVQDRVEEEAAKQEEITRQWAQERYLGDAVYASYDGYQVWLRTGDGNNNVIALEPAVFGALCKFVDEIKIRRGAPL